MKNKVNNKQFIEDGKMIVITFKGKKYRFPKDKSYQSLIESLDMFSDDFMESRDQ